MSKAKEVLFDNWLYLSGLGLLIVINILMIVLLLNIKIPKTITTDYPDKQTANLSSSAIKVDIKGQVNKPGVYELDSDSNVQDLIVEAGGLKKQATTRNINLSKKLVDESMVIIYSATELLKLQRKNDSNKSAVTECFCETMACESCLNTTASVINNSKTAVVPVPEESTTSTDTPVNNKVSINTADVVKLMTLPGVGESKANEIINYRTTNGLFQKIEDITKVSGIGDSIFAKIKDFITL